MIIKICISLQRSYIAIHSAIQFDLLFYKHKIQIWGIKA